MSLRGLLSVSSLLVLLGGLAPVRADIINIDPAPGTSLNAEYRPGALNRPAILVLHGFLQTHDFLATRKIIDGLAGSGLAVLGPNLSFGIPNRRQSLQCEAAHRHTFFEDLREIDQWVGWLLQRGYSSVVLLGHSWGSQHALAYAEMAHERPIAGVIATSLTISPVPQKIATAQTRRARAAAVKGREEALHPFRLSFCRRYMATRESYLSYQEFDAPERIIAALNALRGRNLPIHVIEGGADKLITSAWLADLGATGVDLTVIPDADHFFSSLQELELISKLDEILKQFGIKTRK